MTKPALCPRCVAGDHEHDQPDEHGVQSCPWQVVPGDVDSVCECPWRRDAPTMIGRSAARPSWNVSAERHAADVAAAGLLTSDSGLNHVYDALAHTLHERLGHEFSADHVALIAEALAAPVAYAMTDRSERAADNARYEVRRAIAARLGLGDLVRPDRSE